MPGASGNLASDAAAKSEPDGYTLVLGSVSNTISVSLLTNQKFSMTDDLAPIAAVASAPTVVTVGSLVLSLQLAALY